MENKQEKRVAHPVLRLYSYAKPYSFQLLFALLLIFAGTACMLYKPKIIQLIIDKDISVLANANPGQVAKQAALTGVLEKSIIYIGLICFQFIFSYSNFLIIQWTGQQIIQNLRKDIYNHILSLSMKFFDTHPIGSLVTRSTNDTESINEMFTTVIASISTDIVNLVGIIIIMFSMSPRLSVFVLLLTPFIILVSAIFRKVIRKIYSDERKTMSMLNTKLSENISGMSVIKTFSKEKWIYEEFNKVNKKYLTIGKREVRCFAIYRPAIEILQTLGLAALVWFGGKGFMDGLVTFGVVYAFVDYIQRFFNPILDMAQIFNTIQSAMTSANRVFVLMDEEAQVKSGTRPIEPGGLKGEIEFDNVWFKYDKPEDGEVDNEESEDDWILKGVSFHVKPGEFVAFVGATGAGKSTIISLISRFYDVQKGRVLLDGIDVREYRLEDLRRELGLVQQDVFLFTGNIIDNITLGRDRVSNEAALQAGRLVRADEFIEKLPKAYDEEVAERGATLSAGQRQLLSFARTIAADPSVLILDEATSNIDTETEILIQEAIEKMSENRTMLAVAHRISTIAGADKIIVMHNGRIEEEGTREELIKKDGLFKVLYELQYTS